MTICQVCDAEVSKRLTRCQKCRRLAGPGCIGYNLLWVAGLCCECA